MKLEEKQVGPYKLDKKPVLYIVNKDEKQGFILDTNKMGSAVCQIIMVAKKQKAVTIFHDIGKKLHDNTLASIIGAFNLNFYLSKGVFKDGTEYYIREDLIVYDYGVAPFFQASALFIPDNLPLEIYDRWMGELTGVPLCCINRLLDMNCDMKKMVRQYKAQLNGRKDVYDIKLKKSGDVIKNITHVPCSPDCKETLKFCKKYQKTWNWMIKKYGITNREAESLMKERGKDAKNV